MDQNGGVSTELKQERIREVDAQIPSPSQRASFVLQHLARGGFTNWDLFCFCAEYLGSQHLSVPWVEPIAKHLLRLTYTQHYFFPRHVTDSEGISRVPVEPEHKHTEPVTEGERNSDGTGTDASVE